METILIAARALNEIRQAKLTFAEFSSQLRGRLYQEFTHQQRREIRTFVSCALHKREIARFTLLQYGLDDIDPLYQCIVIVFLCNKYFLKIVQVDIEQLLTWIEVEEDRTKIAEAEVVTGEVKSLFPSQLDFKSPFALSLRYNFPIDFIERLIDDLGFNKTQRFLDKYSNVYQIHGRLNTIKTDAETFYQNHQDFSPIDLKDAFVYQGKASIKSLPSYKDCSFYTMPVTDLQIAEKMVSFSPQTALIVEQEKTSMVIDLAKQLPQLTLEMIVASKHRYHVVNSVIAMFELQQVSVATDDRIEVLNLYDLIYLTPTSSNLEQIKARPDFFIGFDLEKDYASAIYQQLEDYQKHVAPDGHMVVKVGSLLRSETIEISTKFIEQHSDFTLEFQRQYMPYHREQTIAYYAIFRKKITDENKSL